MADSAVVVTAGTGTNIDTRTEGTNGNHRQVVVLGDPSTNAGVAPVDATSGLKVDLGADNDVTVTGVSTAAKQDTIIGHVDGIETSLSSIDGKITAVNTGAVVVSSSALPTGAATAAKQPALGTAGTASADVITVQGIASMTALKVDGSAVTQPVSFTGSGDVATQTTLAAINTKLVTGTDIGDVTINNASGASAVNIQDGGNTITVDYATTGSGTATGALRVELPTNGTGVIATVGAVTAITNALPAGTNAIGKLAANSGVDIGDVTLTAGTAAIGTILPPDQDVTTHTNYAKKYYTNAGAATDGIIWSPAAGKRWHVVSIIINTSAATTVTLEDDKSGGDEVVLKLDLAANSGIAYNFTEHYPLASGEDAADLLVTTSAGNIYITCVGYEI